jgi:hypothetical protein
MWIIDRFRRPRPPKPPKPPATPKPYTDKISDKYVGDKPVPLSDAVDTIAERLRKPDPDKT